MSLLGSTDRKSDLIDRLAQARAMSDTLFGCIRLEALYDRPIPERHRIVFYVGHLEAFDWNLMGRGSFQLEPFQDAFDRLFAFGIDPVDGALPNEPASAWPEIAQVNAYTQELRRTLDERIRDQELDAAADLSTRLEVAIEHRLMHLETLAYMLHQLSHARKHPQPDPRAPRGRRRRASVHIPAGTATLGLRRGLGFGWDNEFLEHTVQVRDFAIDTDSVTNGEFLAFMDDGGYSKRKLWEPAAWTWRESSEVTHPRFWRRERDGWRWHGMFEDRALALDEPVYVSHAEACAFARWRGGSLPTEAEFHRAAYGTPEGSERAYPWGEAPPDPSRGNFDFQRWDPTPCGAHPAGDSAFGVADLVGNGWEWTETVFAPFPGFESFAFYPGYSANFFDGKHYVIKGGSSRTAACMLRRSFRNWFQGFYPFVYAKFRCVER